MILQYRQLVKRVKYVRNSPTTHCKRRLRSPLNVVINEALWQRAPLQHDHVLAQMINGLELPAVDSPLLGPLLNVVI